MTISRTAYTFNPQSVPEGERETGFEPLPIGWYRAHVSESEVRATNAGGEGINLQWIILGPTHVGRIIYHWINTAHPTSEECVKIGRAELFTLCTALGLHQGFNSTTQLHGKPIEIKLAIQPARDGYDAQNAVRAVRPLPQPTAQAPPHYGPQGQTQAPAQTPPAAQPGLPVQGQRQPQQYPPGVQEADRYRSPPAGPPQPAPAPGTNPYNDDNIPY